MTTNKSMTIDEQQQQIKEFTSLAEKYNGIKANFKLDGVTVEGLGVNTYLYDKDAHVLVLCVAAQESSSGGVLQFLCTPEGYGGNGKPLGVKRQPLFSNVCPSKYPLNGVDTSYPLLLKASSLTIEKPSERKAKEKENQENAAKARELNELDNFARSLGFKNAYEMYKHQHEQLKK